MNTKDKEKEKVIQDKMRDIANAFTNSPNSEKSNLILQYLALVNELKKIRKLSFVEKQQLALLTKMHSLAKRGKFI